MPPPRPPTPPPRALLLTPLRLSPSLSRALPPSLFSASLFSSVPDRQRMVDLLSEHEHVHALGSCGKTDGVDGDDSSAKGAQGAPAETLALPAAEESAAASADAAPTSIEVGGASVSLDELGPIIVNADGTTRRITNWAELTPGEQERTKVRIAKRNAKRIAKLKEAAGVGEETGEGSGEGTPAASGGASASAPAAASASVLGFDTVEGATYLDRAVAAYSEFRFVLCFENGLAESYITEKIVNAFLAGAVPIYMGASDVGRHFDNRSFVDCSSRSIQACVDEVVRIDRDPAAYDAMQSHPPLHGNSLGPAFGWHPLVVGARAAARPGTRAVELDADGGASYGVAAGGSGGGGGADGGGGDGGDEGGDGGGSGGDEGEAEAEGGVGTWEHEGVAYTFDRAEMEQTAVAMALRELLYGEEEAATSAGEREAATSTAAATVLPMPPPALPDPSLTWRPAAGSLLEPWTGGGECVRDRHLLSLPSLPPCRPASASLQVTAPTTRLSTAFPHVHLPTLNPPPTTHRPACGEAIARASAQPSDLVGAPSWTTTDIFGDQHEGSGWSPPLEASCRVLSPKRLASHVACTAASYHPPEGPLNGRVAAVLRPPTAGGGRAEGEGKGEGEGEGEGEGGVRGVMALVTEQQCATTSAGRLDLAGVVGTWVNSDSDTGTDTDSGTAIVSDTDSGAPRGLVVISDGYPATSMSVEPSGRSGSPGRLPVVSISSIDASWIVHEAGRQDVVFEVAVLSTRNPTSELKRSTCAEGKTQLSRAATTPTTLSARCRQSAIRPSDFHTTPLQDRTETQPSRVARDHAARREYDRQVGTRRGFALLRAGDARGACVASGLRGRGRRVRGRWARRGRCPFPGSELALREAGCGLKVVLNRVETAPA